MDFQLRSGKTPGTDTGELFHTSDAETALNKFLTEEWWKLSFTLLNGRRVRLVKSNNMIEITDPANYSNRMKYEITS